MDEDEQVLNLDLRSGRSIWERTARSPAAQTPDLGRTIHTDVIIVGAGITGAFVAERMTRSGRRVVLIDRHAPQRASTAASTALLQWELDAPMLELEDRLGFETAAAIYRRSVEAVQSIARIVATLDNRCSFAPRDTIFLAGNELDPADLREELRLRNVAGIDGHYMSSAELAARFGFSRDAALIHGGSAMAHPMNLAGMLLDAAISRGASLLAPAQATEYVCGSQQVTIETDDGRVVRGECLVLANGYEMPPFVASTVHRIVSTWALATEPQAAGGIWPEEALVWEASDPYCYMRATHDRRIIIGGEDEDLQDADRRDALLPEKTRILQRKLGELVPAADATTAAAWTGFFSETSDGLPLIGRVPGMPRCYAAFGYGGNGITFSAIAADIIDSIAAGGSDAAEGWFAIDRG